MSLIIFRTEKDKRIAQALKGSNTGLTDYDHLIVEDKHFYYHIIKIKLKGLNTQLPFSDSILGRVLKQSVKKLGYNGDFDSIKANDILEVLVSGADRHIKVVAEEENENE